MDSKICVSRRSRLAVGITLACLSLALCAPQTASADAFQDYSLAGSFALPTGSSGFDVLPDGRVLTLVGSEVRVETGVGTRVFTGLGIVAGADFSGFGVAFVRVSPDGTTLAIGNGGGASFGHYQVGVFDFTDLSGAWFDAVHFDGEWADGRNLALTGGLFGSPGFVSLLDTASADPSAPVNPTIVNNLGGASGGIAFDASGNLYTGNGFSTTGPSGTGATKYFERSSWMAAIGGVPLDFEANGTLVVDILSAASLGFDAEGNLHVGGGDFGGPDANFAALVHATALQNAILGMGPADILDPAEVRRLDPDAGNPSNYYDLNFNRVTGELYVREGGMVHVYVVPDPPVAAPFPHDRLKNRYVSFSPNNGAKTVAFVIARTAPAFGDLGWVDTPDADGLAKVVGAPVFRVWPETAIHVGDCEIIPVATFEVRSSADGVVFSAPLSVSTIAQPVPKFWGDTVGAFGNMVAGEWDPPNGVVNVNDYVAALQKFLGLASAPHISVVDVQAVSSTNPCLNRVANIADVFLIIKAFQGNMYPFTTDPATCPLCP